MQRRVTIDRDYRNQTFRAGAGSACADLPLKDHARMLLLYNHRRCAGRHGQHLLLPGTGSGHSADRTGPLERAPLMMPGGSDGERPGRLRSPRLARVEFAPPQRSVLCGKATTSSVLSEELRRGNRRLSTSQRWHARSRSQPTASSRSASWRARRSAPRGSNHASQRAAGSPPRSSRLRTRPQRRSLPQTNMRCEEIDLAGRTNIG